jgi:hypothetical protein
MAKKTYDLVDDGPVEENIKEGPVTGTDTMEDDSVDGYLDPFLAGKTKDKDYSLYDAEIEGDIPDEIPEPEMGKTKVNFDDNGIDDAEEITDSTFEDMGAPPERPERGDTSNPGLSEATPSQKKKAAEHMADTIIAAYVQINSFASEYTKFDEGKMKFKAMQGKFDMAVMGINIPISDDGDFMPLREFLDEINREADNIFTVSDEFKEEARPLLIEVFKKKGWGMTPEQRLLFMMLEDLTPKIIGVFTIKSSIKQVINIGTALYEQNSNSPQQEGGHQDEGGDIGMQSAENLSDVQNSENSDDKVIIDVEPKGDGKKEKQIKKRGRPPKKNRVSRQQRLEEIMSESSGFKEPGENTESSGDE